MDSLLQKLAGVVESQDFPHKAEFLSAVAGGRCTVRRLDNADESLAADGTQLLAIYQRRQAHLASQHSDHAQALATDVAWFCTKLKAMPPERVSIWVAEIERPYKLDFFLAVGSNEVLGCIKTVSQLDETPDEWEKLWSNS